MKYLSLLVTLVVVIAISSLFQEAAAQTSYTVKAKRVAGNAPVISFNPPLQNSVFQYSYNPAAFTDNDNNICLVVRCQNSTSQTNPLGSVGPSHLSISCVSQQTDFTSNFSPIVDSSVIFQPSSETDVLGTEDPRVLKVKNTLYMFYTAVTFAPQNQGATARLSLATCDLGSSSSATNAAANPNCWKRQGQLFPDSRPGFQFTKSGALLYDPERLGGVSYLIFGDCSIINGLQIATTTDLIHYNVINNFLLIEPRSGFFDNGLVESGPPPMKIPGTGDWLFVYNSAQKLYGTNNKLFYNPGYVILNGSNPLQVLQRSSEPLLMPSYHFETQGLTPYVVFVEGMVSANDQQQRKIHKIVHSQESNNEASFFLYYGAGDNDVAVAKITVSY